MKKIILFALTLIIAFSFISCNTSYGENFIRNTYPNADFSLYPYACEDGSFESVCEITDEETLTLFNNSFIAVTEYFNVTIEQPAIKWFVDENQYNAAVYNQFDATIYINRSCMLSNLETAIVHEIIHYIADHNTTSGIAYTLDIQGNTAIMGLKLNEGFTEYFAQKIKPFDYAQQGLDVYNFESYIANILSTIVGEEKLKEIYLNNSYQELKDLFDKHLGMSYGVQQADLSLDAFDFFCMQVDAYFAENDEYVKGLRMNSMVDELLIIAKGEEKEKEVKKIINEFGKDFSSSLPFSYAY